MDIGQGILKIGMGLGMGQIIADDCIGRTLVRRDG